MTPDVLSGDSLLSLQKPVVICFLYIHIAHFITRDFAHHELTQDEIDCRLVNRIAIAQRLQPSPHLVDGMYILETYGTSDFVESPSGSPPSMAPSLDYCRLP